MRVDTSIREIGEGTYQITENGPGSSIHQYLLVGRERAMLVDTGMFGSDYPALIATVTDRPAFVVNTHGHLDHISGNHHFEEAWLHPADEAVFLEHSAYELRRAYLMAVAGELGLNEDAFAPDFLEKVLRLPQKANRRALAQGQRMDLGGRSIQVIATPGHTRGSVCLLDESRRQVFTGDTVCDLGVLLNLPQSAPVSEFAASLEGLLALGARFDTIWPGHHSAPLKPEIIQRYLACARRAMAGEGGTPMRSAAGESRLLQHEGIALALPAEG